MEGTELHLLYQWIALSPTETWIRPRLERQWIGTRTRSASQTDIQTTLTAAIVDLRAEMCSLSSRIGTAKDQIAANTMQIRETGTTLSCHSDMLQDLHHLLEDLDNRSKLHNVRFRGLPESANRPAGSSNSGYVKLPA